MNCATLSRAYEELFARLRTKPKLERKVKQLQDILEKGQASPRFTQALEIHAVSEGLRIWDGTTDFKQLRVRRRRMEKPRRELTSFTEEDPHWLKFKKLFWEVRCIIEDKVPLRRVWRIARPLTASWNILNPSRSKIALQHWGVVVASFDKPNLEIKTRKNRKNINEYLGEIHELKRSGRKPLYEFREWRLTDVEKGTVVTYVGQTRLSDEEIMDKGIELIDKYPRYDLLSANCQTFAMLFLEAICEKDENGPTIEEAFRKEAIGGWKKRLLIRERTVDMVMN